MQDFELRFRRLEQSLLRWKSFTAAFAAVIALMICVSASAERTTNFENVKARSINIVDEQGRTGIVLGVERGKSVIQVGVAEADDLDPAANWFRLAIFKHEARLQFVTGTNRLEVQGDPKNRPTITIDGVGEQRWKAP